MLSAGYWLGSVGRKVYTSPMALSGSIGVITAHFSYYRSMKEQGIDVTMFRQGEFKALGSPYEQLDDKAKADIEARMRGYYDMFLGHISTQRSMSVQALIETAAEGRVFMGAKAQEAGLVDAVTSFDRAVALIAAEVKDRQPVISVKPQTTMAGTTDMKRKLTQAGLAAVASGITMEAALKDPQLSEAVEGTDPATPVGEGEAPADVEAEGEGEGEEEGVAEGEDEGDIAADKRAKPTLSAPTADASMLDRIVKLSADLATAQAELATLKTADATRDAQFKALTKIAVDSINRMELPLNRTQSNLKDASADTVLSTYHSVLSAFNGQFKVGGVADVPGEEDVGTKAKATAYIPSPDMASL